MFELISQHYFDRVMTVFSRLLFDTLDALGYSQEVIRFRRNYWQQYMNVSRAIEQNSKTYDVIAGSKGEGLTSFYQSDTDFLCINLEAICIDNVAQFHRQPYMTIIHADTSETPPGYTSLKLIKLNATFNDKELLESAFQSVSKEIFLSSTLFATAKKRRFLQTGDNFSDALSGPAIQSNVKKVSPSDVVFGFSCYYPQLLQSWKLRPRHHAWPSIHVMEDASSMLGQVVPVGSKESCDKWREWRFCFIESEMKLTYSLNDTQLKLYIVLKIVAKEILRQVNDEISSYIMKNVVYWLYELLPLAVFKSENFFTLVLLSLRFLKSAISEWNWFPYYMIPGRNLLAERLTPVNRRQLSGLIETLIQEGPQFFLRCTKFRTALIVRIEKPDLLSRYREKRDRLELLWCYKFLLDIQNADRSYIGKKEAEKEISDTVLPEWRMLFFRGVREETLLALMDKNLKALLS